MTPRQRLTLTLTPAALAAATLAISPTDLFWLLWAYGLAAAAALPALRRGRWTSWIPAGSIAALLIGSPWGLGYVLVFVLLGYGVTAAIALPITANRPTTP